MLRAARSPSTPPRMPTVADGEPDDAARDRAAPCRTGARSAVTASAAVLGRRRATRYAAHLQALTVSTQNSCRAARARPAAATNRLSHRERRLERAGTSNWLEELKDGGGAQPAAAEPWSSNSSWTPSSCEVAISSRQAPRRAPCREVVAEGSRAAAEEEFELRTSAPSCQLISVPVGERWSCLSTRYKSAPSRV